MDFKVKSYSLAREGRLKIEWAERHMPVLLAIRKRFKKKKPFKGLTIAACLHVTKETAVLVKTLRTGGATVALCASNPLSTQDDVAAALADEKISVFAWKDQTQKEYYWCLNQVLDFEPNITLDDGADLISTIHSQRQILLRNIYAGQEETTTGVIRLRAMAADGALKYPVIAVNDTPTKRMFDNVYGTGQSTIDGLLRATNVMIAGRDFVVCGYGYCGSGVARRARGMGARVLVVEVDPLRALKAAMDGFKVLPLKEAAKKGDIFITATGNKRVIRKEHIEVMKDGAILANSGHFNVEISLPDLKSLAKRKRKIRSDVDEYTLKNNKKIYLLAEGRLVNLAAAEGHPSSVMDLSFADQALTCAWITQNYKKLAPQVYEVPREIDEAVAAMKLRAMDIKIDRLTAEQKKYLESWKEGT